MPPNDKTRDPTEIQFTWVIERMLCHAEVDGLTNVVVDVGVSCNGAFADTYASVYQTRSFPAPEAHNFTPYDELTEAQVLAWCWADGVIDKAWTETAVNQQIKNKIAPPTVLQPPLPWAQPTNP